jgi:hypothetical protein
VVACQSGGDGGRRWPEVPRQRQRRTIVVLVISLVPQTPFEWKAELGSAFNTAYNAQLGNVTYYVTSRDYGHPAYLEVRDPRGGLKRLDLGNYHKIEQAKRACERHYAAGCDLGRAQTISR